MDLPSAPPSLSTLASILTFIHDGHPSDRWQRNDQCETTARQQSDLKTTCFSSWLRDGCASMAEAVASRLAFKHGLGLMCGTCHACCESALGPPNLMRTSGRIGLWRLSMALFNQ